MFVCAAKHPFYIIATHWTWRRISIPITVLPVRLQLTFIFRARHLIPAIFNSMFTLIHCLVSVCSERVRHLWNSVCRSTFVPLRVRNRLRNCSSVPLLLIRIWFTLLSNKRIYIVLLWLKCHNLGFLVHITLAHCWRLVSLLLCRLMLVGWLLVRLLRISMVASFSFCWLLRNSFCWWFLLAKACGCEAIIIVWLLVSLIWLLRDCVRASKGHSLSFIIKLIMLCGDSWKDVLFKAIGITHVKSC